LLKSGSNGAKSSTAQAASFQDTLVFCMMTQALSSELLTIKPSFQRALGRTSCAVDLDMVSATVRVRTALGRSMGLSPSSFCIQQLPTGGISLRFFPVTGSHPSAEEAEKILGSGAVAVSEEVVKDREFRRWRDHVRLLYDAIARYRQCTHDELKARAASQQAAADDATARAERLAAEAEVGRVQDWILKSEEEVKTTKSRELETMLARREAFTREDVSVEEMEALDAADREAQQANVDAKQSLADANIAMEKAVAEKQRASRICEESAAVAASAGAIAEKAVSEAVRAHTAYLALTHGPILLEKRSQSLSSPIDRIGGKGSTLRSNDSSTHLSEQSQSHLQSLPCTPMTTKEPLAQ
jgi:hypothetical protein